MYTANLDMLWPGGCSPSLFSLTVSGTSETTRERERKTERENTRELSRSLIPSERAYRSILGGACYSWRRATTLALEKIRKAGSHANGFHGNLLQGQQPACFGVPDPKSCHLFHFQKNRSRRRRTNIEETNFHDPRELSTNRRAVSLLF